MQELRFVAVSEDGSYAVLAVPGRSGRYILPIDERLRAVALGQTSRLAQYEIEVESPLRPKEIQARIRAGETAEEIADAAGIPVERVRWFEGPVLAERAYIADQAQAASVRRAGDAAGPGPRLADIVPGRLTAAGTDPEDSQWDARKRGDGNWQVTLTFPSGGRLHVAEWVFDPRRRHVMPDDDNAARLSLPESELPPVPVPVPGEATVTPIASRLGAAAGMGAGGMGAGGMGAGGGTMAGPGHAGGGFAGNRFRPERSVLPDRSLGADRALAADRTHAQDRSRTVDRPQAPDSSPADGRPAAADYPAVPERPVSEPPAAAEYAGMAEYGPPTDHPSLAYSPAATPVLPRPAYPAGEPPAGHNQVAARPASAEQPQAPAPAAFDGTERMRSAPPRPVVFEDPEPTGLDEHPEQAQAAPLTPSAPARVPPAPVAEPAAAADPATIALPEPGTPPAAAAPPTAEPAAAEKPAGPVPAEPAATAESAAEDQSPRPRSGKKNPRGRRSSVPSWDEIMLGSSRQRD